MSAASDARALRWIRAQCRHRKVSGETMRDETFAELVVMRDAKGEWYELSLTREVFANDPKLGPCTTSDLLAVGEGETLLAAQIECAASLGRRRRADRAARRRHAPKDGDS